MKLKSFSMLLLLSCFSCGGHSSTAKEPTGLPLPNTMNNMIENPYASIAAIPLPAGYKRKIGDSGSFAKWLLAVPLKKDKTVHIFDGSMKANQHAQFAVLDISTGNKNLQQCADAVMRLRAEYLYANGQYDTIVFTDNEGVAYHFTAPYTRANLLHYLSRVFGMCGSASLSKQMVSKPIENIEAGDVFIRGGFPGHAVMVMDVAVNDKGGKVYLLAQSYMPAQDIHVLVNPANKHLSPWYKLDDGNEIITPEYIFTRKELKGW
jgi:hypothetical protein